eukprot:CAMPEP_0170499936 /NCGR_PEP_ID=MMETSP0208-20121228/33126_1 /TAXON_ID=197538 /ORGANISM="Strombidium inclinatum, Strain S3" /LENGTH=133 /DNA_ID=CAMNT_0010777729 /DNA_START=189 /DNA_END=590 /DNA_ORIENTATION=+
MKESVIDSATLPPSRTLKTASSMPTKFDIVHEGELYKLSPSTLKGWQRRYFLLTPDSLKYWKNKGDCFTGKPAKGTIQFDKVKVAIKLNGSKSFDLTLAGCKRVFRLKECSKGECGEWIKALNDRIEQSEGAL